MWPLVAIVAIAYAYRGIYDLKKSKTVRRLTDKGFTYVDRAWDELDGDEGDADADLDEDDAGADEDYDLDEPDDYFDDAPRGPRITFLT